MIDKMFVSYSRHTSLSTMQEGMVCIQNDSYANNYKLNHLKMKQETHIVNKKLRIKVSIIKLF